jgi:hypothetical protein
VKTLFGAVEIAKLEGWTFPLENFNHLGNSHPIAFPHRPKIEVGVDVEVSHLNEIETRLPDKLDQSFDFPFSVRKSGKHEKINRGKDSFSLRKNEGSYCIVESIAPGAMVFSIEKGMGTVEGDTKAVQTCVA